MLCVECWYKDTYDTCRSIDGIALPVVDHARDLGVTVSRDLSPLQLIIKAHKRTAAIYRASRNVDHLCSPTR